MFVTSCILTTSSNRSSSPPIQSDLPLQSRSHIYALVNYEDPYVQPLVLSALSAHLPSSSYTLIPSLTSLPFEDSPCLLILPYESLPFEHILAHPTTTLANAYIIRKALIRKHYLANTIANYVAKTPASPLKNHVPVTVSFELDYAEFLDDAILEAYELHESFARNAEKETGEREWWILKPSMSDRGQGIRLFSSENELRGIFEEWEAENPDLDNDEEEFDIDGAAHSPQSHSQPSSPPPDAPLRPEGPNAGITTSQLRHFVAQPYIPPLLFPSLGNRKFHIRSYVLAVGALRVYVYKEMLALFAAESYVPPGMERDGEGEGHKGDGLDMRRHLTNTCLQSGEKDGSVVRFWDLPPVSPSARPGTSAAVSTPYLPTIFAQIRTATSHLFRAACAQPTSFQPLPNAFEVFGVDWIVDEGGEVWLLEVNAFPDFRQSGEEGGGVVEGVWRGVVRVVGGFWGEGAEGVEREKRGEGGEGEGEEIEGMVRVLEVDMGRG